MMDSHVPGGEDPSSGYKFPKPQDISGESQGTEAY